MFQTKVVEKIKTRIVCLIPFFRKSCRLWDDVEKFSGAREVTDDNATRTQKYVTGTCFFNGKMVLWTCLIVTLYVHCLSCWLPSTAERLEMTTFVASLRLVDESGLRDHEPLGRSFDHVVCWWRVAMQVESALDWALQSTLVFSVIVWLTAVQLFESLHVLPKWFCVCLVFRWVRELF